MFVRCQHHDGAVTVESDISKPSNIAYISYIECVK
jgi:hypothetical protein